MTSADIVIGVQAGQEVPVAGALFHHLNRGWRIDEVDPRAGRLLLLVDDLEAHVAVEVARRELQANLERGDVFLDPPRLVEVVRILELDEVVIAIEGARNIDAEHIAEPGEVERGRVDQIATVDKRLQTIVLQHQVPLVDALFLVAAGEVDA